MTSVFPHAFEDKASHLLDTARAARLKVATAESCTGGLLAGLLTEIPGSSDVVDRGFVTYSNAAKRDLLGVPGDMLADFGAVSEPVARAMAEGAIAFSEADIGVGITGVAGPGGGTPMKPVGYVHVAAARRGRLTLHQVFRFGDVGRIQIRMLALEEALTLMQRQIDG